MAPPVNDDFADRLSISGATGSDTVDFGDFTDATLETDEPQQGTGGSAWWEWTAPADLSAGDVAVFDTLATTGSPNTTVALYEGTAVNALTLLGWNQFADVSSDLSRATAHVVAGQTYQVQVQNQDGGDVTLTWSMGAAPGNDLYADRYNLGPAGTVSTDLTFATKASPDEDELQFGDDASVTGTAWWRYEVPDPAPADITFTLEGTGRLGLFVFWDADDPADTLPSTGSLQESAAFQLDSAVVPMTLGAPWAGEVLVVQGRYDAGYGAATLTWDQDGVGATEEDDAPPPVEEPDPDTTEDGVWSDIEDGTDVPADDTPVEVDLSGIGVIRRVSETYPTPTITDGRPDGWAPSSTVEEDWGLPGIVVDGVAVTKVRGVRSEVTALVFQEPFGEGPAQVTIPGATELDLGQTGFEWLRVEANVNVVHRDADGEFVKNLWSGVVTSMQYDGQAWQLDCGGAFAGVAGMLPHRPKLTERERDWGQAMTYAIRRAGRGASRRKTISEVEFGILTRDRGSRSETLLEFVTRGLSMCQTTDGDQWTLARALDVDGHPIRRKYEWRLKDRDTVDVTVHARARGVTVSLRQDLTDVNRIHFGEGVSHRGERWRGAVFPNIGKETVPTYPGTPLDIGSTGDDVLVWQAEAMSDGHRTGDLDALLSGDFDATDAAAAREIQRHAGLTVTGIVDEDTWDATWSNGDPDLNLGGSRFEPIAADDRVIPFLYSSNGSVLALNGDWDRSLLPLGRFVSYGQNVSRAKATDSADAELVRSADPWWFGTVTLDLDPIEMSRLDIREGMNLRLKWWGGVSSGIVLHIAGVRWSKSAGGFQVTLDVDEKARDLLTLAEIAARNRAARQDPARQAISQLRRSAQVRDTPGVWDVEAGFGKLPVRDCTGSTWNVFAIPAGQYGSLDRVLTRTDPATRYCLTLWGAKVTAAQLNSWMAAPLADPGDDDYLPWDVPGIQDDLDDHLFIEGWGAWKQRAGYSPGYETHPVSEKPTGHDVTGVLKVFSTTQYGLDEEPKMWVAVWPEDDTAIRGQIRLLPNE